MTILSSCASIKATYNIALTKVERPLKVKEKYGGKEKITLDKENKYTYKDNLMKISFLVLSEGISFSLFNKTEYSIKIMWDDCAYIDEENSSHRVVHSGVKISAKDQPQAPSVIASNTSLEETIYPSDYIKGARGWVYHPLLPGSGSLPHLNPRSNDANKKKINELKGKNISVLFVLRVEDISNEYTFIFEIKDVIIERIPWYKK